MGAAEKKQKVWEKHKVIYAQKYCSLNVNHTNMHGFPNDASADRGRGREDKVLWSKDSIEMHYTYSRKKKRLPVYQAKIWTSCCNFLNWQYRCRRRFSYMALAFKCGELQSLSLPGTSQRTILARNKQYLSAVCGLHATKFPFICFSVLSSELQLTPA